MHTGHTGVNVCNYSAKTQIPAHTWTVCTADSENSSNLDLDFKNGFCKKLYYAIRQTGALKSAKYFDMGQRAAA